MDKFQIQALALPTQFVLHCLRFPYMAKHELQQAVRHKLRAESPRFNPMDVRVHTFDDGKGFRTYVYQSSSIHQLSPLLSPFAEQYPNDEKEVMRYLEYEGTWWQGHYVDGWLIRIEIVDIIPPGSIVASPWKSLDIPDGWRFSESTLSQETFPKPKLRLLKILLILALLLFVMMGGASVTKYFAAFEQSEQVKKKLLELTNHQRTTQKDLVGKANKAESRYHDILQSIVKIRSPETNINSIEISQSTLSISGTGRNPLQFLSELEPELPFIHIKLSNSTYTVETESYDFELEGTY